MLFGRAGEESRVLEEAGIAVEVVPGITTALTAAATKQPLIKRGLLHILHRARTCRPRRYSGKDTLVQYMGGREAIATAERLLRHDYRRDTPVIAIGNASRPDQLVHRMTIAQLAQGLGTPLGPAPALRMSVWSVCSGNAVLKR